MAIDTTEATTTHQQSETVVHGGGSAAAQTHHPAGHQAVAAHQTVRTASSTRPAGFVHTPTAKLPSFSSTQHVPEGSNLGRFISIGVIVLLVILLIYQVASKGGLRSQVRTLESEKASLTTQVTALQQEVDRLKTTAPAVTAAAATTTQPATTVVQGQPLTLFTYPVLYRENQYQKIAQTISVTTASKISGVYLRGTAGAGSAGQVAIYESPNMGNLDAGRAIAKQAFDTGKIPLNQSFSVQFQKPVDLKAGVGYVLVVETTKKDAQALVGYRSAVATAPGSMWVYSRKLTESGEVLAANFSWQEIPGYDLFFELRGVE